MPLSETAADSRRGAVAGDTPRLAGNGPALLTYSAPAVATNPERSIVVENPPPEPPPVSSVLLDIEYRHREVCLEHFNGRYYLAIRYEGTLLRYHFDPKSPECVGRGVPGTRQPTSGLFFQGPAVPQLRDLRDEILMALARYNTPIAADLFFCRDPETEAELRALLAGTFRWISGPGCSDWRHCTRPERGEKDAPAALTGYPARIRQPVSPPARCLRHRRSPTRPRRLALV